MLEALGAAAITILSAPLMIALGKHFGVDGVDVHKPWKPRVPKTGGLAMILGFLVGLSAAILLHGWSFLAPVLAACAIAAAIGFCEDFRGELNPMLKPLLLVLAALPILLSGIYTPRPVVPFLGKTRLYRVYPVLVLASYPVVCNAVNSVDILNGSAILTSMPFLAMSGLIFYLRGDYPMLALTLIVLASCAALLPYNIYPAKTFIGNSGSLFLGAVIASIAIVGRIEFAAIVALIPQIMNEMDVIFSIRGLKSAKRVRRRPIEVSDGLITASRDEDAPITLLRMICAGTRVDERRAVAAMLVISCFAAALGLLTDVLFIEGAV